MLVGNDFVFEKFFNINIVTVDCVMLYGVADTHQALLELTDVVHLHWLFKRCISVSF